MKKQSPFRIDEGARRMIFAGIPVCALAVLVLVDSSEHILSEKYWPYIFYGIMMVVVVLGMLAYNVTPKRFILPLGIAGWIITSSILCWVGWFGPHGAFAHQP
jgi:hypothetical protein